MTRAAEAMANDESAAGWIQATLGDFVATRTRGIVPNKTPDTTFELYSVPSLDTGAPEIVTGSEVGSNKQIVDEGTVLLCKINPRINRTWVVSPHTPYQKIASTEWITFPPNESFEPKYLAYYLKQDTVRDFLAANASGVGGSLMRVKPTTLKDYPFPLAPLDQQKRIVAEIEKQFSRLDEAVASLKRVKANLKRYKAAVLKAAVEGRLVEIEAERARREGRSYETGEQLLLHILETRRSQWQGKGKYKEPTPPDTTGLPELPEGWVWASPDQLSMNDDSAICAGPFGTIFKAKDFRSAGVPIIFLRHVSPGQYLTHKPGFMDEQKWQELFQPYSVYGGELLITKLGEPPGICAIYPSGIGPAMVTPDVIKMSVNAEIALSSYLMFYFNSEVARKFSSGVAFGTTRTRLTIPIFREMPVAVPPLGEQHRIVAEVDRRLSLLREAEAQVDANLQRTERLRQSILAQAFSGRLKLSEESVGEVV